jgi:WD40 repeat protein
MSRQGKFRDNSRRLWGGCLAVLLLLATLLAACGDEQRPTPDYSTILTPPQNPNLTPTVTAPFQAASSITTPPAVTTATIEFPTVMTEETVTPDIPEPTSNLTPASTPENTPIIKPTPSNPTDGMLTSDNLGITAWSDSDISWAPTGDVFMLHILRGTTDGDLYYMVRPPDSIIGSFRLSRDLASSMVWSPDGRYLAYIDKDPTTSAGPVILIDSQHDTTRNKQIFAGPCTNVTWLAPGKIVAACGLAVYLLSTEPDGSQPETLYRLDNGRFPNSNIDLGLIYTAIPSPDGNTLAIFALRRQKGPIPIGEVGFYNLNTRKITMLDRNERPITVVDWTPDSRYLILRNLVGGEWLAAYTFDFYLADPQTLKITQNLTKSNDKCDPILGSKPECQGAADSAAGVQSQRVLFAPDGNRYFVSGLRYGVTPGSPLSSAERLSDASISGGKLEQILETKVGERVMGLTWLPNGHYFYSVGLGDLAAKAYLDGKLLDVPTRGLPIPATATPGPTATKKIGQGSIQGLSILAQGLTPLPAKTLVPVTVPPTQAPPPTAAPPALTTAPPATQAPQNTPAPATNAPQQPTQPPTATPLPPGTPLLGFDTATALARVTPTPYPTPVIYPTPIINTPTPAPTPTPSPVIPRPVAYYISPSGNWLLAVDRIATTDKTVQFQVRLIPFSVK